MVGTIRFKVVSILLVAVMTIAVPLCSWADDSSDMSFSFDLTVDGQTSVTVQPGSEIDVEARLVRTDEDEGFDMYAVQYDVWYNSDIFELVSDSISGGTYGLRTSEKMLEGSRDGWSCVSASAFSSNESGDKWDNGETVLAFKLKAKKTGSASLQSKNYSVSKTDGMSSYDVSANDANIAVKTPDSEKSDTGEKTDDSSGNSGSGSGNSGGSSTAGGGSSTGDNTSTETPSNETDTSNNTTSIKPSARFYDVAAGSWYENAVGYVVEKGLFSGISENSFSPNGTMTRAMLVTVLSRLADEEDFSGSADFSDVESGKWYTAGVAWASSKGIVSGYGDGKFGPNDEVTREQMALIMYNFTKAMGYDITGSASLDKFSDSASVHSWAADAMKWAVGTGIMSGNTDGTLNPRGTATRAQVATIMMNYVEVLLGVK